MQTLTQGAKTFIDENIDNFDELKILLLLRQHPEKEWDAVTVAQELKIEPISASNYLMALYLKGLLGHQEARGRFYNYRYRSYAKGDQQLSQLAEVFERMQSEVLDYIYESKRRQLAALSNAFDLKRNR